MALNPRQSLFVQEYLIDLNATQAAIRAGYSKKRASELGYQLLQKPTVQEALREAMAKRERRTAITQDRVLAELAAIAFANGADYAHVADPYGAVEFTPTAKLTNDQRRAIASIKQGQTGTEVKTYDKLRALELLGKHMGLFSDSAGVQTREKNNLLDAIQGVEVDTDGIPEAE